MISFVLPTRNRPTQLAQTIDAVAKLGIAGAEVIVIDNASDSPAKFDSTSADLRVRTIALPENLGAAARNIGAREAENDWIVMLDDDSHPLDAGVVDAIADAGPRVGAIAADIRLPDGSRERGGLPEVFVGCGVAIRRELFLTLGGYDHAFGYYAEEYDLCARIITAGFRIAFDHRFRVQHRKVNTGRDFGTILRRLVRNNGWVLTRYAPEAELERSLGEMLRRYAHIAEAEGVAHAFAEAHEELRSTIDSQQRTPLSRQHWERFTGLAAAREALEIRVHPSARTAAIIEPGKNEPQVREAIARHGLIIVGDAAEADVRVIGTLSPGPMLDAINRHAGDARLLAPWLGAMPTQTRRASAA
ncbi:MAG: glycosyltransferase [Planctomycetota bacterium]